MPLFGKKKKPSPYSDEKRLPNSIEAWSPRSDLEKVAGNDPSLTRVAWLGKGIGDGEVIKLAKVLRDNTHVTQLWLWDNKISNAGAKALAKMLRVNTTITQLDLAGNKISDAGAKALAEVLRTNGTVTHLNLGGNNITDDGANALAEVLQINGTITELWLGSNKFTDAGAKALAEVLRVNGTVTTLYLANNEISGDLEQKVNRLAKINKEASTPEDARRRKGAEFGPPRQAAAKAATSLSRERAKIDVAETTKAAKPPLPLQDVAATPPGQDSSGGSGRKAHGPSEQERRDRELAERLQREEERRTSPTAHGAPARLKTAVVMASSSRKASSQSSKFYTKLMEEDDRNIVFKISELVPLVEDVHHAIFFYTLVNFSHNNGGIMAEDRSRYVSEGLRAASTTTTCTESVALFKLLLDKASADGAIADKERYELDREAEVTHTSNAPFVRELREHIRSNTARIEGLEKNAEALSRSLEKLKAGLRFQRRVEATVGLFGAVLNAVSLGAAGSALSAAVTATIGSIVDFGDVVHIRGVVGMVGDASVKDAFQTGLSLAEEVFAGAKLDKATTKSNPIVAIAFAAKVMENDNPPKQVSSKDPPPLLDSTKKATPSKSLIDRVKVLEEQLAPEEVAPSISGRISSLETLLFGCTQEDKGSFLKRVAHLESELGLE